MDMEQFREIYDREQRVEIEHHDMQKEAFPNLVRHTRPAPGTSYISYSHLDEKNAERVIAEQVDLLKERGLTLSWKVYDYDTPADLKARLLAAGFAPDEVEAVMILDLAQAPQYLLDHQLENVRKLESPQQLREVVTILEQVWGGSYEWVYERMGASLAIPGYLSIFVADADDQPACCGWTYYEKNSRIATLWGGSTLPAARGRGLYTAVLAARLQDALKRGYQYLCVDAGSMSLPILEKHGFQLFTHAQDFEWKAQPVKE